MLLARDTPGLRWLELERELKKYASPSRVTGEGTTDARRAVLAQMPRTAREAPDQRIPFT